MFDFDREDLEIQLGILERHYGDGRKVILDSYLLDCKNNLIIMHFNDTKVVLTASNVRSYEDFIKQTEKAYIEARFLFVPDYTFVREEVLNALKKIDNSVEISVFSVGYYNKDKNIEVLVHHAKGSSFIFLPLKCDYGARAVEEFKRERAKEEIK